MTVPLWEKYLLTIEEAAVYFGIGENRLRELAALDMKREFTIDNGNRILTKRKKFEGWSGVVQLSDPELYSCSQY